MKEKEIYNDLYFKEYRTEVGKSAYAENKELKQNFVRDAKRIVDLFNPRRVLDIGCALGFLVEALRDLGVEAYGMDISEYAVNNVRDDIKGYCKVGSIADGIPLELPKEYDLVVTVEMMEHLYPEDAEKAIKNICSITDTVLFSSTPDEINDPTHVNVQLPETWARIYAYNGFFRAFYDVDTLVSPWEIIFKKDTNIANVINQYEINKRLSEAAYKKLEFAVMNAEESKAKEVKYLNDLLDNAAKEVKHFHDLLDNAAKEKEEYIKTIEDSKHEDEFKEELIKDKIDSLNEKIRTSNDELERLNAMINTLNGVIVQKDAFINELNVERSNILNSTAWKITRPLRACMDKMKRRKVISQGKNTQPISNNNNSECLNTVKLQGTITEYLNQQYRQMQAVPSIYVEGEIQRINFVTDSIAKNSLLGGVATALIITTEFANKMNIPLRIITRDAVANPSHYENIIKMSEIENHVEVTYYCDNDRDINGNKSFKLDISEKDIFIATSWWSAEAIKKMNMRNRFYYIIQEIETYFYPHGDMHLKCMRIMKDTNIDFIINSSYLHEYFKENHPNVVKNGVFFEPAFPKSLYHRDSFEIKKKKRLFFYARPNNPRNLFLEGIELLNEAVCQGILNNDWEICFAGQELPPLQFDNGMQIHAMGLMDWEDYGKFLQTVDITVSLMYTPHPSYPPFDSAASGGVVITNRCLNKQVFPSCDNVLMFDLEKDSFLSTLEEAISLSQNIEQRKKNYENMRIARSWKETLPHVLKFMEEKLNDR